MTTDRTDAQILACLRRDGRASYATIGVQVGLSAPAVKRRVDRLLETGASRGFTALVDPAVLGWSTEAYVEVYCAGNVSPESLRRTLESIPEVVDACTVTGDADALVHLRAEDMAHMEAVMERVRGDRRV